MAQHFTVLFRGVMLFRRTGQSLDDILIPNCSGWKNHEDGSTAVPHEMRVWAKRRGDGGFDEFAILGTSQTWGSGDHPQYAIANTPSDRPMPFKLALGNVVPIDNLEPGTDPRDNPVGCRIELFGGSLRCPKASRLKWTIADNLKPGHRYQSVDKPPLVIEWRSKATTLSVVDADGHPTELSADDYSDLRVGNLDQEDMDPTYFDHDEKKVSTAEPTKIVTDNDFKWLFRLHKDANGMSWPERLGGGLFPAPYTFVNMNIEIMVAPLSTCFTGDG